MTAKELATKLNGREYLKEMSKAEEAEAKQSGLVVIFGYSDDNMEIRGAEYDEIGAWGGGAAYFKDGKLLVNKCESNDCPHFAKLKDKAKKVVALWDEEGYSWVYKTDIPHETFDIMEDGEKFCRGIVFSLDHVTA